MFHVTTAAGQIVDVEALWQAVVAAGAASMPMGVLVGVRLALDEPELARVLSVYFVQRAGERLGEPDERIEIQIRQLVGEFLRAAKVKAA